MHCTNASNKLNIDTLIYIHLKYQFYKQLTHFHKAMVHWTCMWHLSFFWKWLYDDEYGPSPPSSLICCIDFYQGENMLCIYLWNLLLCHHDFHLSLAHLLHGLLHEDVQPLYFEILFSHHIAKSWPIGCIPLNMNAFQIRRKI